MNYLKHLSSKTGKAIGDFKLINEGDRILVGLSGGKDSWTLLHVLYQLKKKAPSPLFLVKELHLYSMFAKLSFAPRSPGFAHCNFGSP